MVRQNEEITETVDIHIEDEETVSLEYLMKIIQELPDRYRLVFNLYVIDAFFNLYTLQDILKYNDDSIR